MKKENKISDLLFKEEIRLSELDRRVNTFENFCVFNKATGLGKTYRTLQLKIRICKRLLNLNQ